MLSHVTEGAYCFQFLTCFIIKMTGSSDKFFVVGERPYYGTDLFREVLKSQFLSCVFKTEKELQLRNGKRAACNNRVMAARGRLLSTNSSFLSV